MGDQSIPPLSVIVPVYGVEEYVGDCLDSIIAAPGFFEYCQLVVVDDGSPDGSMAIVERRCSGLTNVRIVRQVNSGLGAARNTGLAHATGRYVWFVDSDDEICRDAIVTLVDCIGRHASDIIAFEFETIGGSLNRALYLSTYDHKVDPVDFLASGRPPSPVQFYAFRREALERAGLSFHPSIYHEDALFTPLMMTRSHSLVRLREACYRYRLRAGSIMSVSRPERHFADMFTIAGILASEADTHSPGSKAWKALGREVGFALASMRHYAVRVPVSRRHDLASIAQVARLGNRWWRQFPTRVLINYLRLLGILMMRNRRIGR